MQNNCIQPTRYSYIICSLIVCATYIWAEVFETIHTHMHTLLPFCIFYDIWSHTVTGGHSMPVGTQHYASFNYVSDTYLLDVESLLFSV